MVLSARDLSYESIAAGTEVAQRYTISPAVHARFMEAFEDVSPIHVDEAYARTRGFKGKVMHGAILNGFVSNFVGVHFPGRRALLLSVDLRFANPSYLGDVIEVHAAVTQKVDAERVIVLRLAIENVTQGTTAATGRAQVRIAET
jgi:acyl dehydratase